ncbi:MAG: hypothetical protein M3547_09495 [Acidobacteriota bacterium]|nr:hypothetical protein [Acidobacteriota bacterium]
MSTGFPASEDLVGLLRRGSAPREIRLFAARGLLPLEPDDSLRALLAVMLDPDREYAATARQTLRAESPDRLAAFARSAKPLPAELDVLARESDDPFVLEEVVRSRDVRDSTLLHLAQTATGRPQEALIANQARLIAQPALVTALRANPGLTTEGRRLLAEFTEEFHDKGIRRREDDARRAGELAESEAAREELDLELDLDLEGEAEPAAEGEESETPESPEGASEEGSLSIGAVYRRIALMTIPQKIDLAHKGSREERRILIGDTNKLIGLAVLKSRGLTDNEVEGFAAMRNLDEELYRRITKNREWMRRPAVSIALVRNPRVPLDVTLPLLKRLSVRDLRAVFRDRNLAPVIRTSARRILVDKRR